MKKALILALIAMVSMFMFACSDDDSNVDGCKSYCDKTKECDETGTITEEVLQACYAACEAAGEEGAGVAVNDDLLACADEASCDDFATCITEAATGDDGDDTEE